MTARSAERAEFLSSIITTAVEGGTGYWACVSEYKWEGLPESDVFAVLHEMASGTEPEDELLPDGDAWSGWYFREGRRLDIEKVASAIQTIIRGEAKSGADTGPCDHCGATVKLGAHGFLRDTSEDPGDGDGGDASCPGREPVDGKALPHELKYCDPLGDYAIKTIAGASATNDGGDIDADMADIIAQVALLGVVRYG